MRSLGEELDAKTGDDPNVQRARTLIGEMLAAEFGERHRVFEQLEALLRREVRAVDRAFTALSKLIGEQRLRDLLGESDEKLRELRQWAADNARRKSNRALYAKLRAASDALMAALSALRRAGADIATEDLPPFQHPWLLAELLLQFQRRIESRWFLRQPRQLPGRASRAFQRDVAWWFRQEVMRVRPLVIQREYHEAAGHKTDFGLASHRRADYLHVRRRTKKAEALLKKLTRFRLPSMKVTFR